MAEIGIVIPVYNVEAFLPRCLDSVIAQGDPVREIVLVNDGSTDESLAICRAYAERDPRIAILDKRNGGVYSAVVAGAAAVGSPCIGFVDGDDFIEPDTYARAAARMEETGADVVFWDYDVVGEDGEPKAGARPRGQGENGAESGVFSRHDGGFAPLNLMPALDGRRYAGWSRCNKLFRRELLLASPTMTKDYGVRCGDDCMMILPALFAAEKIAYLPAVLYHYVQRAASIMHESYGKKLFDDWATIVGALREAERRTGFCAESVDTTMWASFLSRVTQTRALPFGQRKREIARVCAMPEARSVLEGADLRGARFDKRLATALIRRGFYGLLALLIGLRA